jgi:phage host-nuclease inhibitor protein Gam
VNKPTRLKTAAVAVVVPHTKGECAGLIAQLGEVSREAQRLTGEMNDQISAVTQGYQPRLERLQGQIEALQKGVQTWCEANRAELTRDGRVKSANLVTGEVQWRQRPPSCRVTGAEAVIEALKRLGLGRFVRSKDEINKEAILNEPEAVAGVAGIAIQTGVEDFVIVPFEQTSEVA